MQSVDVRGRIVELRPGHHEVVIDHEAIPGRMGAMTMPFSVEDPGELEKLQIGDAISFRYSYAGGVSFISSLTRLDPEEAETLNLAPPATFDEQTPGSIYALGSGWTNQYGEHVELKAFAGRPVLLSMVFTNCAYACPMIVRDMKQIADRLPAALADSLQYVLVSVDPERDTPEVLRRFAEGHGLDLHRWTLLRGDTESVRMLAALLGIRYRQQADGQFAHTSLIATLNEAGEIIYRHEGVGGDPDASASILTERLFSSYEPVSSKYQPASTHEDSPSFYTLDRRTRRGAGSLWRLFG